MCSVMATCNKGKSVKLTTLKKWDLSQTFGHKTDSSIENTNSNSSIECTFSFVTNILSDKCLSMSHDTLENSVIVSGNNSIWSEKEREEIIDRALEISANTESPCFPLKQTRSRNLWWTRWRWSGQWRRTLSWRINGF